MFTYILRRLPQTILVIFGVTLITFIALQIGGDPTYLFISERASQEEIEATRIKLGFDKPQLGDVGPTCGCVSMTSFGHSGFTGTLVWADPETQIVYVFLSNRIHPDATNKKLLDMDVRTDIMEVIFNSVND